MKRDTLLEKLELPINQNHERFNHGFHQIWLTTGSHDAPEFRLTRMARKRLADASLEEQRSNKLAISTSSRLRNCTTSSLVERCLQWKRCATPRDMNEGDRAPCVDIFVQNAKFVGILQTKEGAEFIASIEDATTKTLGATTVVRNCPRFLSTSLGG